ncbi:hypothetical protein [Methylobacterium sp. Leaf456]|uniref:hypothetical protein n=1 Tax=Methylobacterium sp. Leaf456 TaxID=1736382 RepID=UPI000A5C665F|nr:hypothetical protein [Methylobacterium sp. Leaf456]
MATSTKIIENIISELSVIHKQGPADITKGDVFPLPRLIPAGQLGQTIQINKKTDDLITSLAHEMKRSRLELGRGVKNDEWRQWVRSAIGPLLAKTSLKINPSTSAPIVLSDLEAVLKELIDNLVPREYAFGVRLFGNHDVQAFSFGPAMFEPREDWLDRKAKAGDISAISQRRVKQIWSGKKLAARKHNIDQMREQDIIKSIGTAPYICTVQLKAGFASDAGLETALATARLALACVSLAFEKSSRALSGFGLHYDGPIHLQKVLTFIPGNIILSGSRFNRLPFGPKISDADWKAELTNLSLPYASCSDVLDYFTDSTSNKPQNLVLNALLQSLLWFERGCREGNDLVAIINLTASLDALAKGDREGGIVRILDARLGFKPSAIATARGQTFQALVKEFYTQGRSRGIHGTSDRVGYDWSDRRATVEFLARNALLECLDYAAKNPGMTAPGDFQK